jgi:alanyl-tRNA synthetase
MMAAAKRSIPVGRRRVRVAWSSMERVASTFKSECERVGLRERRSQSLLAPGVFTELNRCIEHSTLVSVLNGRQAGRGDWYSIARAARINDTRKVSSGTHATVFEVLTTARYIKASDTAGSLEELAAFVIRFLSRAVRLDRERLLVTFFAGSSGVSGIDLPVRAVTDPWVASGISLGAMVPVRGVKNSLLFVGEGERCGPKWEILYRLPGSDSLTEVATVIWDNATLHRAGGTWVARPSAVNIVGAAFGLERLAAVRTGRQDFSQIEEYSWLIETVEVASRQQRDALALCRGDVLVLVDQIKAVCFLLAEGLTPASRPLGSIVKMCLQRIRRKLAILDVEDPIGLAGVLAGFVVQRWEQRHPGLRSSKTRLVRHLAGLSWPESWNPESYDFTADS